MTLEAAASIATALSIFVAGYQLWQAQRQARTSFEDTVAERYLDFVRELPVEALLGGMLSDEDIHAHLSVFYRYFDYSNWQAFLHQRRRVRNRVWWEWREGIEQNLRKPAFAAAWVVIASRSPDSFDELRRQVPLAATLLLPTAGRVSAKHVTAEAAVGAAR